MKLMKPRRSKETRVASTYIHMYIHGTPQDPPLYIIIDTNDMLRMIFLYLGFETQSRLKYLVMPKYDRLYVSSLTSGEPCMSQVWQVEPQVWQAEPLVNLKSDKSFLVDPRSQISGGSWPSRPVWIHGPKISGMHPRFLGQDPPEILDLGSRRPAWITQV